MDQFFKRFSKSEKTSTMKGESFRKRVSEYQHDLIHSALNRIWGDAPPSPPSVLEEEDEVVEKPLKVKAPVQEFDRMTIGTAAPTIEDNRTMSSYESGGSSVRYDSNGYRIEGQPLDLYPPPPPSAPVEMGPNGPVHDISFLQEFQHLFTKGCKIGTLQFKHTTRDYVLPATMLNTQVIGVGKILVVKSHLVASQIEIGILVKIYTLQEYYAYKATVGRSNDPDENYVGLVIRIASHKEKKRLPMKHAGEVAMLAKCQDLAMAHQLPIDIHGVEFQFDGLILYIYYKCEVRIDYRRFVYDVIKECNGNSRVVMKRTNTSRPFIPNQLCANSLCTGRKYVEDEDMHKHIPADPTKYIPSELLNF